MKLKLDENLGKSVAQVFISGGHDVATVYQQNMASIADKLLVRVCANERRCLVTLDMDFANTLIFDPSEYAGIAVLRLPSKPNFDDFLVVARTLIVGLARADISGKLWIVRRQRIREYQQE